VGRRHRLNSVGVSTSLPTTSSMTSATSTVDLLEEADLHCDAVCLQVEIPDGRLEEEDKASRSVLRVEGLEGDKFNLSIKLSTSHYAFSLKRSSTIRSIANFYTLAAILKDQHPVASLPSLPVRPLIYLCSYQSRNHQLATWLASILVQREILSNRALHLFLQTNFSMGRISENADGIRDDQVIIPDRDEGKQRDGFRTLFGNSYETNRRMLLE